MTRFIELTWKGGGNKRTVNVAAIASLQQTKAGDATVVTMMNGATMTAQEPYPVVVGLVRSTVGVP